MLSALLLGLLALQGDPRADQAPPAPTLGLARWLVVPARSTIGFDGVSSLHDFTGKTHDITGELRLDPRDPEHSAGGEVSLAAASLDTDNGMRDDEMREHLEVKAFPRIVFALDALVGTLADYQGDLSARGRFTICGVERERVCAVQVRRADARTLHVTGDVRFKMSDHGVEPPSVLMVKVRDEVRVWFDLILEPPPGEAQPARAFQFTVTTRTEPLGGTPTDETTAERLFAVGNGASWKTLLWERDARGSWIVAHDEVALVDARAATRSALPGACEELFADTRQRAASMRAKLDALPADKRAAALAKVSETLGRLEQALSIAPTADAPIVQRETGLLRVSIGGVEWLRAEGIDQEDVSGTIPFLQGCLGLEGLPATVRAQLASVRRFPQRLMVRCATPAGVRTLEITRQALPESTLPPWAIDVASWTAAPRSPTAR